MTPIRFTVTEELSVAAARANNLSKWPRFVAIILGLAALYGAAVELFFGQRSAAQIASTAALMTALIAALCLVLFLVTRFWTIPHKVNKALSHFDAQSLNHEIEWDDRNFQIRSEEGHSSTRFARLAAWKQTSKLILIYRTDDLYWVIPSSIFMEADRREELIERLRSAGVRQR